MPLLLLPLPLLLATLLLCTTARGGHVGEGMELDTQHSAPAPDVSSSFVGALDPRDLKEFITRNLRIVSLGAAASLLFVAVATCVMSTDVCVRRRLNRNRQIRLSTDTAQND